MDFSLKSEFGGNKRQLILILVLVILIVLFFLIFKLNLFKFSSSSREISFSSPTESPLSFGEFSTPTPQASAFLGEVSKDIFEKVFSHPVLKKLNLIEKATPPESELLGKENPFLPSEISPSPTPTSTPTSTPLTTPTSTPFIFKILPKKK